MLRIAVGPRDQIVHARGGENQIEAELSLEPLPRDLHMEKSKEAAAKPETQRSRGLGRVVQCGIVELELLNRVPQVLVMLAIRGVHPAKHHAESLSVAGQRDRGGMGGMRHRVAHSGVPDRLHGGGDEADFAAR